MESSSGRLEPCSRERSFWADLIVCLGLFAMGITIDLIMVRCASAQCWLTGEEVSVAFKDVVFLPLRLQHDRYDTNLGGHILYFLAHAIHPHPGLWYGRETKAILMALAGPLTYLFGRRLSLGRTAAAFSGLCLFLFPGFSAFSWIGMEAGLEVLFGGLALYLVSWRGPWAWPVAAGLIGFGILVYGGCAAYVLPVLGMVIWRLWQIRDRGSVCLALVAAAIFAAMLALPSLWWINTVHAYRGGATIELAKSPILFLRLLYESFYKPHSYYFFSTSPSLGGFLFVPLLAAGIYASSKRTALWWPLWLVALGSIGLYSIATPTGVRRAIPLVFVASLLAGEAVEWAGRSRRIPRPAIVVAWIALPLILAGQSFATAHALVDGRLKLPHDFDWISSDMTPVLEDRLLEREHTRFEVEKLENPIRAMCILYLLQVRQPPRSSAVFTLEEIREYYLTADQEKYK